MAKTLSDISDLSPDPHNLNTGTPRGRALLERSLRELGAGRSILVDANGVTIAGNKTLSEAAALDFPIRVVQTDGTELVVVQRTDLDLAHDTSAQRLAIADNRIAELDLKWQVAEMGRLLAEAPEITDGFFTDEELQVLADSALDEQQKQQQEHSGYPVLVTLTSESQRRSFCERMQAEGLAYKEWK